MIILNENIFVLRSDGTYERIETYRARVGLKAPQASKYFTVQELQLASHSQDFLVVCEPLMEVKDAYRSAKGRPVYSAAYNRSPAHQQALRDAGLKAAITSPHVAKMASDIDTASVQETNEQVVILRGVIKELGYEKWFRIGWKVYQPSQSFMHLDCCPWYYAKGRPWHAFPHPTTWEVPGEW